MMHYPFKFHQTFLQRWPLRLFFSQKPLSSAFPRRFSLLHFETKRSVWRYNRVEMLCYVTPPSPSWNNRHLVLLSAPPWSSLTSDHMWGVRSFKGSECEQNVWNCQWSILDRDLLKSHLLDMFPRRRHFSIEEGPLQWQNVEAINSFSVSFSLWMSLVAAKHCAVWKNRRS